MDEACTALLESLYCWQTIGYNGTVQQYLKQ